jgi:hypothetical protein
MSTARRTSWTTSTGADTSFVPGIGAVNPAVTAIANGIRVGEHIAARLGVPEKVAGPPLRAGRPATPRRQSARNFGAGSAHGDRSPAAVLVTDRDRVAEAGAGKLGR